MFDVVVGVVVVAVLLLQVSAIFIWVEWRIDKEWERDSHEWLNIVSDEGDEMCQNVWQIIDDGLRACVWKTINNDEVRGMALKMWGAIKEEKNSRILRRNFIKEITSWRKRNNKCNPMLLVLPYLWRQLYVLIINFHRCNANVTLK